MPTISPLLLDNTGIGALIGLIPALKFMLLCWQKFAGPSGKLEIIYVCSASSFISYWAGLQDESGREELEAGAGALKTAALYFHSHDPSEGAGTVLLQ